MAKYLCFTFDYNKRANVLKTPAIIKEKLDPKTPLIKLGLKMDFSLLDINKCEFLAIWDTGATGTVITNRVVNHLKLQPVSMAQVIGAYGGKPETRPVYLVTIYLPNGVCFVNNPVTSGEPQGCDILIGMDIISLGDFSVTNHGGGTKFSFRIPSKESIDFVKDENQPQAPVTTIKIGRNQKCPCGSGKKYKYCCGK